MPLSKAAAPSRADGVDAIMASRAADARRGAADAQDAYRAAAAEEAAAEAAAAPAANGLPAWVREARQQLEMWPRQAPKLPPWVKLETAVLADARSTTVDVCVMAALSSFGGATAPDGRRYAWPSIPSIQARAAGLRRTAVITALNRLVKRGYVDRFPHGWGRSTVYRFK